MKIKFNVRILLIVLAVCAVLALCVTIPLVSCKPPKLEDVKGTFTQLIEDSHDVNEILFGEGLSVYAPLDYSEEHDVHYTVYTTAADGKLCAYYNKEANEYKVLRFGKKGEGEAVYSDEAKGVWLYATDLKYVDSGEGLSSDPPSGYHYVRLDERCTSVKDITEMASKVYSEDYLRDVFAMLIAGDGDNLAISADISAKYCEKVVSSAFGTEEKKVLLRADHNTVKPMITETRSYDYDSMKILRNSRKNFVLIEIDSYGTYVDKSAGEIKTGWSTIRLSFVKENGAWRLDSPTY